MSTVMSFRKVSKIYEQGDTVFYALREADLDIEEGELVVILGPSGAGKSTLLNLMSGMDDASEGTILFEGKDITSYSDDQLTSFRAKNVGIVFQFYNLVQTLTVYENVALMKDIQPDIMDPEEALKLVGLEEHRNKFPAQLSGGQQQRISIARALVKNPRLLFCDEPTGALDTNTGKEVLRLLQDMSMKHGRTVVIVTHNPNFAMIANKVLHVKNGRIEQVECNEHPMDAYEIPW